MTATGTTDRQFCAQLLCLFLAHERDPLAQQGIGADELDKVYHENTRFDVSGVSAQAFRSALQMTTKIVEEAIRHSGQSKKKFRKIDIIALFLVVCDLSRTATFKFDKTFTQAASEQLISLGQFPSQEENQRRGQQFSITTRLGETISSKRPASVWIRSAFSMTAIKRESISETTGFAKFAVKRSKPPRLNMTTIPFPTHQVVAQLLRTGVLFAGSAILEALLPDS